MASTMTLNISVVCDNANDWNGLVAYAATFIQNPMVSNVNRDDANMTYSLTLTEPFVLPS